jgi:import inner membrane translocase subunit TIM21
MMIPVQGRLIARPKFGAYAFLRGRTSFRRQHYATHHQLGSSGTTRKAVTLASDDGRIPWSELSAGEKMVRSTQQSFNFAIILIGIIATGGVGWFLYQEVFSFDSKTHHFNEAHTRIKKDKRCVDILGNPNQIRAFGESTWNRWTRNRHIASTTTKDRTGTEHLYMHFNVQGPLAKGVVRLHMTKTSEQKKFEYKYLALDVPGHQRIYLENADTEQWENRKSGKMFGVRWW